MEDTTQRFQRIATTLADLNTEGFNAQSVDDLLTMHVGAASQHVFRMSFVPEQEAHNFDRQVTTFWSHLIQRDVTSPLFFLPLKLGGLGVGLCSPAPCGCPMARVAVDHIIPTLMATTQVTGHTFPLQRNTTTESATSTTPDHTFTTNERACFPLKTTWSSPLA